MDYNNRLHKKVSVKESMDKEQEFLYEKFKSTGQEKVKLSCALEGFFPEKEETSEEAKNAYSQYLKRRIRPAMEELIRQENICEMEQLAGMDWFGRNELESFIRTARKEQKLESLVWLMKLKDSKYGYTDRDFTL